MSGQALVQMADLLPLAAPPATPLWPYLVALVLVLLILFSVWWWRRTRDPFRDLLTGLKKGSLTPRDVAHQLAKLNKLSPAQQTQLDRIRFCRQAPNRQQIARLLRSTRNGR